MSDKKNFRKHVDRLRKILPNNAPPEAKTLIREISQIGLKHLVAERPYIPAVEPIRNLLPPPPDDRNKQIKELQHRNARLEKKVKNMERHIQLRSRKQEQGAVVALEAIFNLESIGVRGVVDRGMSAIDSFLDQLHRMAWDETDFHHLLMATLSFGLLRLKMGTEKEISDFWEDLSKRITAYMLMRWIERGGTPESYLAMLQERLADSGEDRHAETVRQWGQAFADARQNMDAAPGSTASRDFPPFTPD